MQTTLPSSVQLTMSDHVKMLKDDDPSRSRRVFFAFLHYIIHGAPDPVDMILKVMKASRDESTKWCMGWLLGPSLIIFHESTRIRNTLEKLPEVQLPRWFTQGFEASRQCGLCLKDPSHRRQVVLEDLILALEEMRKAGIDEATPLLGLARNQRAFLVPRCHGHAEFHKQVRVAMNFD